MFFRFFFLKHCDFLVEIQILTPHKDACPGYCSNLSFLKILQFRVSQLFWGSDGVYFDHVTANSASSARPMIVKICGCKKRGEK